MTERQTDRQTGKQLPVVRTSLRAIMETKPFKINSENAPIKAVATSVAGRFTFPTEINVGALPPFRLSRIVSTYLG